MSKKTISIVLITLSVLCFSTVIWAQQYYLQYPGNCFHPEDENLNYYKSAIYGTLKHYSTLDSLYFCPVNFNTPDGPTYFIKSIGIRYMDNLSDAEIVVDLYRRNLYTGNWHKVAGWYSDVPSASSSEQTASQGTIAGYKLIDSKKFSYWLRVYFYREGSVSPGTNLALYQVRIHYGT